MNPVFEPGQRHIWINRTQTDHPYLMSRGHYHDYYELYFLLEGETRYQVGDEVWFLRAGDVILVPKGVLHNTANIHSKKTHRVLITFSETALPPEFSGMRGFKNRLISLTPQEQSLVFELLKKLEAEQASPRPMTKTMLSAYLSEILVHLSRAEAKGVPDSEDTDWVVSELKQYIGEHYAKDLTLEELGKVVSLSPCHLSKKFRKLTGFGLWEYIELVRMMHAEQLLLKSRMGVAQIAEACGFKSPNYFSSVFKRIHGSSPKAYQKNYSKGL